MTVTPVTPIDALPTAPSRSQSPETFSDDADAFLGALPGFGTQLNAAAVATEANAEAAEAAATTAETAADGVLAVTGYVASSTDSETIGTGAKVFTIEAGKAFAPADDRVTVISRGSPDNRMRGSATYSGTTLTITVDEIEGSGTFDDWLVILTALEVLPLTGLQVLSIPAAALTPRTTNGPSQADVETTTNKVMLRALNFDASTAEYAQFAMRMPKSWNEGTVAFAPIWSHAATATNFGVVWGMRAVALSNDDAADAAFGTAQTSTDTGGTTNDLYIGPKSADITIAGSPAAEGWVVFEIYRDVSAGGDTLAVDARLHGFSLYITTDARNDA